MGAFNEEAATPIVGSIAFGLLVGTVLDTASAILVLTPLLANIAAALGVDLVHFGIIVVMNLSIGTFTPPFGLNIFVGQAVFKVPLSSLYPGLIPFIVLSLVLVLIVLAFTLAGIAGLLGFDAALRRAARGGPDDDDDFDEDDDEIGDLRAYGAALRSKAPGDVVKIRLKRGDEELVLEATLVAR